ncbi:MAG TPA: entericidin A/B family lipoprotein [Stellaceae bacterium]|nr:entericidin A/B family lipoprotein [Stellaceae bacterium]
MRSIRRTMIAAVVLAAGAGALAACNTMAGAGEDMQKGGSALTNSADKHGATMTPAPTDQTTAPAPTYSNPPPSQ